LANFLTCLGLFFALISALLVLQGRFFWAGAVLLLSGGLDLMDGAVARLDKEKMTAFGGIFDSSLDRYGDGFVWAALIILYASNQLYMYAGLAASAMIGSFSISYVRARAECVHPKCRVGFWERGERLVYLSLGLLFNNAAWAVLILGIGTHLTVFSRLYYAANYRALSAKTPEELLKPGPVFLLGTGRSHALYWAKVTALFLSVVFVRIG
jgi:CDP-diacylglycerol--glycerol-3-phosphate 3-phosphatidyltransferase